METLVVGAGAVGRWFADLVPDDVAFADVEEEAAEAAAEQAKTTKGRTARAVPLDTGESFGLVCVAVPLRAAETAVRDHATRAQTAVIDLTGRMAAPLQAMAEVAPARERASFHPLFAPSHAPGRIAMSRATPGPAIDRVTRWLTDAGNELVAVDAAAHDEAMVTVQGRVHAAILAFGLAADAVPPELRTPVHEGLTDLLARVTDGEARVYSDIQAVFGGAADIAEAAERIAAADDAGFAELYAAAGEGLQDRAE
ncbi:MAG: prephenate dehydrogenase [Halobacteriaceae archaeon]